MGNKKCFYIIICLIFLSFSVWFNISAENHRIDTQKISFNTADANNFTYSYMSVFDTTRNVNATRVLINYGEYNNTFYHLIVDEPNNNYTGVFDFAFQYYDSIGNQRRINLHKDLSFIETAVGPGFDGTYLINLHDYTDALWLKNTVSNYSSPEIYPHGVIDFEIIPPQLETINDNVGLNWSIQSHLINAFEYSNGTADWNINCSFYRKLTFHFIVENQTVSLKMDIKLSNFSLNNAIYDGTPNSANFSKSNNITQMWDISVDGDSDLNWTVDGVEIEPESLTQSIANNATISFGNETLSEIDFGNIFLINDTEQKNIKTQAGGGGRNMLLYNTIYPELNLTDVDTIELDPEVKIFFGSPNLPPNTPSIPGFTWIFAILSIIMVISIIYVTTRKQSYAKLYK
ncbi:MAG: hypothetical protein EAX96_20975 [Candidatus Lokiarchaeota archaeon]|nr:hypothetical protein [Candidatus Lokiarchaeota archaeon]